MSKELKPIQEDAMVPSWTPDQMDLVKRSIAKGATEDEFKLFAYRCKDMGLDPFKKEIYFVKYGGTPGTIIVGIDGFRKIAHRSGRLSGIERGVIRNEEGICVAAWAKVYRSDWTHPAYETVSRHEYDTGKNNWSKMPETMLKKVAEASALRMAFPNELGEIYEQSEMDQAQDAAELHRLDSIERKARAAAVEIDQLNIDAEAPAGERLWLVGKTFYGKKIKDIPGDKLQEMLKHLKGLEKLTPEMVAAISDVEEYFEQRKSEALT